MTTKAVLHNQFLSRRSILLHDDEVAQLEARLTINLIERWGMMFAAQDGEDSSGRQKVKAASPTEIVQRACDIAEITARELRTRNWLTKGPTVDDILEANRQGDAK